MSLDARERLALIQQYVRDGNYFATKYAERRWADECGYTWAEFEQWVARLKPEHRSETVLSTNPDFPEELVDKYVIRTAIVKKGRVRAIWIEVVICEDYLKVVSAHRTTLKREQ